MNKVAQPRAEPRVKVFEVENAAELEQQVNEWIADQIRRRRYGGGGMEVMQLGDRLLGVVQYNEIVAIDIYDQDTQKLLYSETPGGVRMVEA